MKQRIIIGALVLGIVGVIALSWRSWSYAIAHWKFSVPIVILLALRIYVHWRHDRAALDQAKMEVLCVLDEAPKALNQIQLMRRIKDEQVQKRLDVVLDELSASGQIEVTHDRAERAWYRFSFNV